MRKRLDIEPQALLTGIVDKATVLRNEVSDGMVVHAKVATYGTTIDCVFAAADLLNPLSSGNIVQGRFWLMGRLLPSA